MSVLSAQSIRRLCKDVARPMIYPFNEKARFHGMTYGLSESGYDIRIDQDITLYPRNLKYLILNALGFKRPHVSLASSIEYIDIPDNLMVTVLDKSTWARKFILLQNSVAEPSWKGYLTLEITCDSDKIVHIKRGMPIAQLMFHVLDEPTENPYRGKYQDQKQGPQEAIFERG